MASSSEGNMMQLLGEMKQLFPQLPEHIISSCLSQCQNDSRACCRLLEMYNFSNENISESNVAGTYSSRMEYINSLANREQFNSHNNSPSSARSFSFSGTTSANAGNNLDKPQSAPVHRREIYFSNAAEVPTQSSYFPVPIGQYAPPARNTPSPRYHVSTYDILPRHTTRVDMEINLPSVRSSHLSVSTNGPAFSNQPMQLSVNSPPYPQRSSSPRLSPRPNLTFVPGNDRQAFLQALLTYQGARYEQLYQELSLSKDNLQTLRREVTSMEETLQQRTAHGSVSAASGKVLQSMRDEITKLRVDCHCLSVEADSFSQDQLRQGSDFYQNIFTGQVGPIPPVSTNDRNGNRVDDEEENKWKCSACTFANHPALNKCEMCEMPRKIIA